MMHRALVALALIAGSLVSVQAPAQAHDFGDFYDMYMLWQAERGSVNIYHNSSISGAFRDRLYDGAKRWDLELRTLNFTGRGLGDFPTQCADNPPRNANMTYRLPLLGLGTEAECIKASI